MPHSHGNSSINDAMGALLAAFNCESGTLHVIASDGALHLRAASGIPASVLDIVRVVPVGKGMAGLAAQRKQAVSTCNLQTDCIGDIRLGAKATGLGGSVCVPLLSDTGEVVGILGVGCRAERVFTKDEEARLMVAGAALLQVSS
ncbi:MAG: GAF domain-containing protein [Phycisphaerales bacterium]|nr:GAF domain-containing protein [Phycisphaerales bacterium]